MLSPSFTTVRCPTCGHLEDRVLDTRVGREGDSIRRRRECLSCHSRFTTLETMSQVYPYIIKKDGRHEPFAREKVLKGIQAACQKRPVSLAQMEQIVDRVAKWVLSRPEREVTADAVGQKVIKELRLLDDVAYVRFASVYTTFKDIGEFVTRLGDSPPLLDDEVAHSAETGGAETDAQLEIQKDLDKELDKGKE
jgi:transcriptional repressor NrdR